MSAPADQPILEARELTRVLEGVVPVTLVKDISVAFRQGEWCAITGPSGSGKSSLLYLLGLLDQPTAGEVLVKGEPTGTLSSATLAALRLANIGFVFQFHFLLPEFRVIDNVMVPMRKLGRLSTAEMHDRAADILSDLGLADHMKKHPDQLSGGQRQRVAVARAMANNPDILLADEPTGSLDQHSSQNVADIFNHLSRELGKTIVMVTHEMPLADQCDRILRLVDGALVDIDEKVPA